MSKKRKDHKGRILKTGESQRKDLIYQYRYTDCRGKRQTIYDADLQEPRKKEKEIQNQVDDGIDYEAGQITVIELLEKYISLKQGVLSGRASPCQGECREFESRLPLQKNRLAK